MGVTSCKSHSIVKMNFTPPPTPNRSKETNSVSYALLEYIDGKPHINESREVCCLLQTSKWVFSASMGDGNTHVWYMLRYCLTCPFTLFFFFPMQPHHYTHKPNDYYACQVSNKHTRQTIFYYMYVMDM